MEERRDKLNLKLSSGVYKIPRNLIAVDIEECTLYMFNGENQFGEVLIKNITV